MLNRGRHEARACDEDAPRGAQDGHADRDRDAQAGPEVGRDGVEEREVVAVAGGHEPQPPARLQHAAGGGGRGRGGGRGGGLVDEEVFHFEKAGAR